MMVHTYNPKAPENDKFEDSQGYIARCYLKTKTPKYGKSSASILRTIKEQERSL